MTANKNRSTAEAERDAAKSERDAATKIRDDALTAAKAAEDALKEIRARFDPQIQVALANIIATAPTQVCTAADAAGFAGQTIPALDAVLAPILAAIPASALPGVDVKARLPLTALQTQLTACYNAAKTRRQLDGPHGDGLATIP